MTSYIFIILCVWTIGFLSIGKFYFPSFSFSSSTDVKRTKSTSL